MRRIKDNTEAVWVLGTDCLPECDLEHLGKDAYMDCEYASMYGTKAEWRDGFMRFSDTFKRIIWEARQRGYVWVLFDCNIETEYEDE